MPSHGQILKFGVLLGTESVHEARIDVASACNIIIFSLCKVGRTNQV